MSSYWNGGTNNRWPNEPARMSDGRIFAAWQPSAVLNEQLRQSLGLRTNAQYRHYLQTHGNEIIRLNAALAHNDLGISPYIADRSGAVEEYTHTPIFLSADAPLPENMSDLQREFVMRQRLAARSVAPFLG